MSNKYSNPPVISVITVVYNDYDNLQKTLSSINRQTDKDFEFIVIDGGSTDGSLDLIGSFSHLTDLVVSEKDKGIYDAMNRGVGIAKGKYVNFMNAGDEFYGPDTIKQVKEQLKSSEPHILYGKVIKLSSENSQFFYERGGPISGKSIFITMPICHQSMFTARELFDAHAVGLYDLDFKTGADYEWLAKYYETYRSLDKLVFLDEFISIYLDGGYSFHTKKRLQWERLKTAIRHYSPQYILLSALNFLVEYSKAIFLPFMLRWDILDAYRRIKYASKSMMGGAK